MCVCVGGGGGGGGEGDGVLLQFVILIIALPPAMSSTVGVVLIVQSPCTVSVRSIVSHTVIILIINNDVAPSIPSAVLSVSLVVTTFTLSANSTILLITVQLTLYQ